MRLTSWYLSVLNRMPVNANEAGSLHMLKFNEGVINVHTLDFFVGVLALKFVSYTGGLLDPYHRNSLRSQPFDRGKKRNGLKTPMW